MSQKGMQAPTAKNQKSGGKGPARTWTVGARMAVAVYALWIAVLLAMIILDLF